MIIKDYEEYVLTDPDFDKECEDEAERIPKFLLRWLRNLFG